MSRRAFEQNGMGGSGASTGFGDIFGDMFGDILVAADVVVRAAAQRRIC